MARRIPLELPTKKYIKAYLISQFGEKPLLNTRTSFGSLLYDLLSHKPEESFREPKNYGFDTMMKIYINSNVYYHRGAFISLESIKKINEFIQADIKNRFHFYMDFYIETLPSFEANLPSVRERIGIGIDAWDSDSMKKDYYRYRMRTGRPLLYKKSKPFKLHITKR